MDRFDTKSDAPRRMDSTAVSVSILSATMITGRLGLIRHCLLHIGAVAKQGLYIVEELCVLINDEDRFQGHDHRFCTVSVISPTTLEMSVTASDA